MSLNTFTNQTIALAGISQATTLVHQLATTGKTDQIALEASIGSLLKLDSDNVVDIFGGLNGLQLGLERFQQQITGHKIKNIEQARYAASLVYLERKLNERPEMMQQIHAGIVKAQNQAELFELLNTNVLANLGDLYHETISSLQPRIMVNGEEQYLSRLDVINKIRALLLAGIRAAMLWRQCGGARWKFLFYRGKLQEEVELLLKKQ